MNLSYVCQQTVCPTLHFLVDGLCVCCLYLAAYTFCGGLLELFVLYNILAFLTQPFTGMLADKVRDRLYLLLSAVALLSVACVVVSVMALSDVRQAPLYGGVLMAMLLGAGNSLFHVWGGKQTVDTLGNDPRALGMFVSTGAFGLAVGVVFFSWMLMAAMLAAIVVLSTVCLLMDRQTAIGTAQHARQAPFKGMTFWITALVVMLVLFRSFVSQGFSASVVDGSTGVLLVGLTAMLGKMFGGWLAWLLGMARSMLVVLVVLFFCYLAAPSFGGAVLLTGLFAVNCTMPVTLCVANGVLPGREGLAFGLLAAALVPGYLLAIL